VPFIIFFFSFPRPCPSFSEFPSSSLSSAPPSFSPKVAAEFAAAAATFVAAVEAAVPEVEDLGTPLPKKRQRDGHENDRQSLEKQAAALLKVASVMPSPEDISAIEEIIKENEMLKAHAEVIQKERDELLSQLQSTKEQLEREKKENRRLTRSQRMSAFWKGERLGKEKAIFDTEDTTDFFNPRQKNEAVAAVKTALAFACSSPLDSVSPGSETPRRASPVKRLAILSAVCAELFQSSVTWDDALKLLTDVPLCKEIKTALYAVERITSYLNVVKNSNNDVERENYHVVCASFAAPPAEWQDQSGMGNKLTTLFKIRRSHDSVYQQSAVRRGAFDDAEERRLAPTKTFVVGDKVDFVHGS